MKTIKDIETYWHWNRLDWEEKLDVTINTMFIHGKINSEERMRFGDYGDAIIELCCIEEDEKLALTVGWIKIKEDGGSRIELNLWRGNGQPYFTDESYLWDTIYNYLERLEE